MSADPITFEVHAEEVVGGWHVTVSHDDALRPTEAFASTARLAFGIAASAMCIVATNDVLEQAFRLPPAQDGPPCA